MLSRRIVGLSFVIACLVSCVDSFSALPLFKTRKSVMDSPATDVSTSPTSTPSPRRMPSLRAESKYDFNKRAQQDGLFIGISGMIGAGKSTLADALGKELGLPIYYEPVVDNVYLSDFYEDMSKYAFPMQIYLLNRRFKQQQQIIWEDKGGVQDRTIYEDSVFARMLRDGGFMEERDFETYMELFRNMSNFMKRPNVIVHLDVTPEESARRIKMRSRDCEKDIPLDYLKGLHEAYENFIADIARVIPVIKVDYSRFRTVEEMARMIREEYDQIANIRTVGLDDPRWEKEQKVRERDEHEAETPLPQPDFTA